jgi:hypothetical protein
MVQIFSKYLRGFASGSQQHVGGPGGQLGVRGSTASGQNHHVQQHAAQHLYTMMCCVCECVGGCGCVSEIASDISF